MFRIEFSASSAWSPKAASTSMQGDAEARNSCPTSPLAVGGIVGLSLRMAGILSLLGFGAPRESLTTRWRARQLRQQRLAIVSFPKSGRTWLRVMLGQLGISPLFSHEKSGRGASIEYTRDNIRFSRHRRVIFLHRNPLDTIVSYFFHSRNVQKRFAGDISEFIRSPGLGIRHLLEFNKAWLEAGSHFDDFLVISYEELRADPAAELRQIVDFCNLGKISDRKIKRAVEAGEFSRMKKLEQSGKLAKQYPGRFADGKAKVEESRVRAGLIGNYRSALSDADIEYCLSQAREVGWPLLSLLGPDDPLLTRLQK
jgi:hypothetical protein